MLLAAVFSFVSYSAKVFNVLGGNLGACRFGLWISGDNDFFSVTAAKLSQT